MPEKVWKVWGYGPKPKRSWGFTKSFINPWQFRRGVLDFAKEICTILDEEPSLPQVVPDAQLAQFPITDSAKQVLWICRRFSSFVTQLTKRQQKRKPLVVVDEYDVQDVLHALLRMHLGDVRPEEPTLGVAGRASRIDFLLKAEHKTRTPFRWCYPIEGGSYYRY